MNLEFTHTHTELLQRAFEALLGPGQPKDMAYCTCLPAEAAYALGADMNFAPSGWRVFVVTNEAHAGERRITSGQAVELREAGGAPTLLLVDAQTAGAGMNGIYSASREVREAELFEESQKHALTHIVNKGLGRSMVQTAARVGTRLRRRAAAAGWDDFDFHAHVAHDVDSFGRHIARLGLWPIDKPAHAIREDDIDASFGLTRRLFGDAEQQRTARGRVDSLFLKKADAEIAGRIEQVVERGRIRSIAEVMQAVVEDADLWLGRIEPEFLKQQVQTIELVSWMPKGRLSKWSGLTLPEGEEMPEFVLPTSDDLPAKLRPRLEVRFLVTPELQAGAAEYRVIVRAGDRQLAARTVAHQKKKEQSVRLTDEDFEDFDVDSSYEAEVVVALVGGEREVESEPSIPFIVKRGEVASKAVSENARFVRSLVQGAIASVDEQAFTKDCQDGARYTLDEKRGYVVFRPSIGRTSYKLARPSMIASIERQSADRCEMGRWRIRVRADGQPIGDPEFILVGDESAAAQKMRDAHEAWREETAARGGSWGRIYAGQASNKTERYVNAWCDVVEGGKTEYALLHTVEVRTQSDRFVGMIVLPGHPVRVAWHAGYDEIARHWRYVEGATDKQVNDALDSLDGGHFPAMLPGPQSGQSLVFADVIGFYAVAMLDVNEREPNAQIALLKAALGVTESELISAVGGETSRMVADEVRRYVSVHPVMADGGSGLLRMNALRPGDGAVIARALGEVVKVDDDALESEAASGLDRLRFQLDLYPADVNSDVTGRFLTRIAEAHRAGASGIDRADRWMLERRIAVGQQTQSLPGLSWARRMHSAPDAAAHLSVVFDFFETTIEYVEDEMTPNAPLHVYGLIADARREYVTHPEVLWRTWVPQAAEGLKHPAGRGLSERLVKAQRGALRAVATHHGKSGCWPVLTTRLNVPTQQLLSDIHALSDWVVTVDRNAGIEYFDSPAEGADVFDSYVIDCVPARGGLGNLRMVTSTTRLDEVEEQLERVLDGMEVRYERRDVLRYLRALKALSGRMAMRLASLSSGGEELVALAMLYEQMRCSGDSLLEHGFLVPLDDVPELIANRGEDDEVRADLVHVGLRGRVGLTFTFMTVRHRRHLRYAKDHDMLDAVERHLSELQQNWKREFFPKEDKDIGVSVNRARLVRVLRFYADKALRHALGVLAGEGMDEEREARRRQHARFLDEIDKLVEKLDAERIDVKEVQHRLYVFCPELNTRRTAEDWGELQVQVFGPQITTKASGFEDAADDVPVQSFPEVPGAFTGVATEEVGAMFKQEDSQAGDSSAQDVHAEAEPSAILPARSPTSTAQIVLGHTGETQVTWTVSSKANPHLLMVGLSGMGKTEALLNIMRQMTAQGIVPIVLSYHPDIDQRMSEALGNVQLLTMNTLGYNPMIVTGGGPNAHVDNAGMLRDGFAAIWPDLGEVQLSQIRSAIKQSYEELGWRHAGADTGSNLALPSFGAFYEILRREKNPDRSLKTLLGRLEELDDYGILSSAGAARSLLSMRQPAVLSLHESGNENVQRALTMLALHGMYTDMFRRGVQTGLTHAIVVDEAHRASKLKWLVKFAKEGRKFGISLILASQSAADFQAELFSGIASYLLLRMTEQDATHLTKAIASSDRARGYADRLKRLDKYEALLFTEGRSQPDSIRLKPGS